jgi:hypothetical protein
MASTSMSLPERTNQRRLSVIPAPSCNSPDAAVLVESPLTMAALPSPIADRKVSSPPPPTRMSLPLPATRVSLPPPPIIRSLPLVPVSRSFPLPATTSAQSSGSLSVLTIPTFADASRSAFGIRRQHKKGREMISAVPQLRLRLGHLRRIDAPETENRGDQGRLPQDVDRVKAYHQPGIDAPVVDVHRQYRVDQSSGRFARA